jgi:hypothetical protein
MLWDTNMAFHPCAAHWITAQTLMLLELCKASVRTALQHRSSIMGRSLSTSVSE